MTAPLDIAQGYLARGWFPVPIAYREKGPKIPGWQNLRLTAAELPQYFNGHPANIGVLLGEPSGGLADVDLDCEETVRLARSILPETIAFGRRSKRRSHLLFSCPGACTEKFVDPRDRQTLVELRSTGGQTVFPGSTHPSGELVEWETGTAPDATPLAISPADLRALVAKLAVAALIARRAPDALDDFRVRLREALREEPARRGEGRPQLLGVDAQGPVPARRHGNREEGAGRGVPGASCSAGARAEAVAVPEAAIHRGGESNGADN